MTDEGMTGIPVDAIELGHAMRGIAEGCRAFYEELVEQGFTKDEALRLTLAYIAGMAGGKIA